ncbi:MAG: transglycosylase domain-containing protein [Bacteriovoracia bacterium]
MMAQQMEFQPTVVYSDVKRIKKGDLYDNLFLPERLKDLRIAYQTPAPGSIQWTTRQADYPESIPQPTVSAGAFVKIISTDGMISSIQATENGETKELEEIILEPTPVAQLSGGNSSIRDYRTLDQIPTKLSEAIIAIEDQRFLEHVGFDPRSLARALWINIKNRTLSQGGSTLTQQLVKNLLGKRQKTLSRKFRELILAILIEFTYSKDAILEKYLNEVYFGQIGSLEVHGVAQAAKYFFNKSIEDLSLAEKALIAGVIRGPGVYSPYRHLDRALERKDLVLKKMAELKLLSQEELNAALAEKLTFAPPAFSINKAPYFTDYVKAFLQDKLKEFPKEELDSGFDQLGLKIYSTLDLQLQAHAAKAVLQNTKDLEQRYKITPPLRLEGILVAAEPSEGAIVSLVGGRSYGESTFNRVLNMKRQVGSSFKPVAYLAAILKGKDEAGVPYSPAYMIDDMPWTYEYNEDQSWSPKNYEKEYRGRITLHEAFANSINIPMAKIGIDVGLRGVMDTAYKLGVKTKLFFVPSMTLGSIDLNATELLQVYSTIANRGVRTDLFSVRAVTDQNGRLLYTHTPVSEKVFEPAPMDVLRGLMRNVTTEGTARSIPAWGYKKYSFGKTGTTSFSRDAWFSGYSEGIVAITWIGFDELKIPNEDDEEAVKNFKSPALLTGAGAALPSWIRFMISSFPSKQASPEPEVSSELVKKKIDRKSGLLAKPTCPEDQIFEDWFMPDTWPTEECNLH